MWPRHLCSAVTSAPPPSTTPEMVCKHTRSANTSLLPFPTWTPASQSTLADRTSTGEKVGDMHELRMGPQLVVNRDKPQASTHASLRDPMLDGRSRKTHTLALERGHGTSSGPLASKRTSKPEATQQQPPGSKSQS